MKHRFRALGGQIKYCKGYGQANNNQHWNESMPDEPIYHALSFQVQRALRASPRIRGQ